MTSVDPIRPRSTIVPRLAAASMPSATPTVKKMTAAPTATETVTGSRCSIIGVTGWSDRNDQPRQGAAQCLTMPPVWISRPTKMPL